MGSEVSLCRPRLAQYCKGVGLDIGFGGDPIVPTAITLDLETPYCSVGSSPQNLSGTALNLHWFTDHSLDYIFVSHLLEDFSEAQLRAFFKEALRVLHELGYLVIYSPNQRLYFLDCRSNKTFPNQSHKYSAFGLTFLLNLLNRDFAGCFSILLATEPTDKYSFDLVLIKILLKTDSQDVLH